MAASILIKTQARCLCPVPSQFVRKATKSLFLRRCQGTAIIAGETDIDPVAIEMMDKRGVSFKGHPGVMTLKSVNMPERLERAVEKVTEKYPVSNLSKKSEQLNNYLQSRQIPVEEHHLRKSAQQIYNLMLEKADTDLSSLGEEERERYEAKIQHRVLKKLRSSHYHWTPINYDAPTALVYLQAQMAYNYSAALQCFTEISRREPDYRPRAMFDFGSGLGSSVWAGSKVWGTSMFEYYCVDTSRDMNTLARLLLQDGDEQKLMQIHGVFFRQFLPSPDQNSFSVVVCGHTLLELSNKQERLKSLSALWKMTDDFLVLVENGSTAGFSLINEAKEYLLQLSQEQGGKMFGHVFAPCPHDGPCPKLRERKSPCMFSVSYKPGQLSTQKGVKQSSRYSYVIMRKGKKKEEDVEWPRIIQAVTKAKRHVHCHLCCPNATLSHEVLTQKKHGRNVYKCSRYSNWGDLLPVRLPKAENNQSMDQQQMDTYKTVSHDLTEREKTKGDQNRRDRLETEDSHSDSEENSSCNNHNISHNNPLVL